MKPPEMRFWMLDHFSHVGHSKMYYLLCAWHSLNDGCRTDSSGPDSQTDLFIFESVAGSTFSLKEAPRLPPFLSDMAEVD